jgi:hypothetical protein
VLCANGEIELVATLTRFGASSTLDSCISIFCADVHAFPDSAVLLLISHVIFRENRSSIEVDVPAHKPGSERNSKLRPLPGEVALQTFSARDGAEIKRVPSTTRSHLRPLKQSAEVIVVVSAQINLSYVMSSYSRKEFGSTVHLFSGICA